MSSYPYALTWAKDEIPAILWTSHAGQETGHAIADVLLGAHSPTGRLSQTWYQSDDDLPGILEYDIIKARRTYQYFDGTPLYPFGHGLTYTTFDYAEARVSRPGSGPTVTVQVEVTNTGTRPGVEVVQVYTRLTGPTLDRPARRLAGWSRVWLEPGLTRTVTVDFPLSSLAIWDVEQHGFIVEPGTYEVLVGSSCTDIHGTADLVVTGDQPGPRQVVGIDVTAADFDDYAGITLVDTTREAGDAVEAVDRAAAWVLFRAADLSTIPTRLTVRVSQTLHQSSLLELRTGKPDGPVLATAVIPSTGDRYAWVDVTTEIVGAHGVQDLYLLLRGDFRIDTFRLHD
jgi:beta-glucosidase